MDDRTGATNREHHTRSKKRAFYVEIPGILETVIMSGASIRDVESKVRLQYGVSPDLVQPKQLREDNPLVQNPMSHKPFEGLSALMEKKEN